MSGVTEIRDVVGKGLQGIALVGGLLALILGLMGYIRLEEASCYDIIRKAIPIIPIDPLNTLVTHQSATGQLLSNFGMYLGITSVALGVLGKFIQKEKSSSNCRTASYILLLMGGVIACQYIIRSKETARIIDLWEHSSSPELHDLIINQQELTKNLLGYMCGAFVGAGVMGLAGKIFEETTPLLWTRHAIFLLIGLGLILSATMALEGKMRGEEAHVIDASLDDFWIPLPDLRTITSLESNTSSLLAHVSHVSIAVTALITAQVCLYLKKKG